MPWDVLCRSEDRERTCRVSCLHYREDGTECPPLTQASETPIYDALRLERGIDCRAQVGPIPKLAGHTCRCNKLTLHQLPHTCDCGSWFESRFEPYQTRDLFTFEESGRRWPFFEDEDGNITGYGHQDRATFAHAVNLYNQQVGGLSPDDTTLDHRDVTHRWATLGTGSECEPDAEAFTFTWGRPVAGQARPEPFTADEPGAFPITCVWGVR